jgi:aryl-alcohol dehydrogenase-like predicted oxidoreductase
MRTRKLGWTDLNLTTVGLGTWAMGGGDWKWSWGPQNDAESIAAVSRAMELGINWIDTAPVYGLGHSEEVVGQALEKLAKRPIIATKCSLLWDKDKNVSNNLKKASVQAEIEASLKRLGVDVIDLYQIHWPNPDQDIEEGWSAIADQVKAGKIRYAGVCNFSVEQIKRVQPIHPVASLQPPYSMLVRGAEQELLDYSAANKIGVVVYSPMQKGLLTGKFKARVGALAADDHRLNDPDFAEPRLSAHLELVESLRPIAAKSGKSVAHLAIAWVLRRPELTAAIVGARRPSQIEETAAGGDWVLSPDDLEAIDALLDKHQRALGQ